MSQRRCRLVLGALAVMVVATAIPTVDGTQTAAAAGPNLNGGGSSFAKLEIDQWRAEVAREPLQLSINYNAQGSSFGRQQYSSGSLDFAASDIPFLQTELDGLAGTAREDFVYVPVSAGGLGFMYNLVDTGGNPVTNLNLTPRTVCRIFTDDTIRWNDPEIAAVNSVSLPDERVRAIVRADGSGTSYVLSEYCIATATDVWEAFKVAEANNNNDVAELLAGRPTSTWPTNRFGSASYADGVAAAVADSSSGLYSITYNEAGFAKVRGFPNANVQNAFGNFTQPTENAVSIALGYATGRENGTFQLDFDGPDPNAYFPSTYSYVIAQTTGFDPAKGEVLARFLCYAITRGQRVELTELLGYARLSAPLVELGKNAIAQIPGAPPWEECRIESAAPPPAATPAGGGTTGGATTGGAATGGATTGGATTGGATTGGATTGGATTGGATTGGTKGATTGAATDAATDAATGGATPGAGSTPAGATAGAADVLVCADPDTGLPAACDSLEGANGSAAGDQSTNASNAPTATAAKNPPIDDDSGRPTTTQILWWLLQGASICAVGFALAGVRTRLA
jgi:ABC-type phosphate transport system substrate-binding protein